MALLEHPLAAPQALAKAMQREALRPEMSLAESPREARKPESAGLSPRLKARAAMQTQRQLLS